MENFIKVLLIQMNGSLLVFLWTFVNADFIDKSIPIVFDDKGCGGCVPNSILNEDCCSVLSVSRGLFFDRWLHVKLEVLSYFVSRFQVFLDKSPCVVSFPFDPGGK